MSVVSIGIAAAGMQQGLQCRDGGVMEQGGKRRSTAEGLLNAGNQARRSKGMPSHQEKIVGDAEIAMAEHLCPKGMKLELKLCGRFNALLQIAGEGGSWERFAIELAVGCKGEGFEPDEGRREHVVRKGAGKESSQLGGGEDAPGGFTAGMGGDPVSNKLGVGLLVLPE